MLMQATRIASLKVKNKPRIVLKKPASKDTSKDTSCGIVIVHNGNTYVLIINRTYCAFPHFAVCFEVFCDVRIEREKLVRGKSKLKSTALRFDEILSFDKAVCMCSLRQRC